MSSCQVSGSIWVSSRVDHFLSGGFLILERLAASKRWPSAYEFVGQLPHSSVSRTAFHLISMEEPTVDPTPRETLTAKMSEHPKRTPSLPLADEY